MTFEQYVLSRIDEDSPVGALALDYAFDQKAHKEKGMDMPNLTIDLLTNANACDAAIQAFYQAQADYLAEVKL